MSLSSTKASDNWHLWCYDVIVIPEVVKKSVSMAFQIKMLFQKYTGCSMLIYSMILSTLKMAFRWLLAPF